MSEVQQDSRQQAIDVANQISDQHAQAFIEEMRLDALAQATCREANAAQSAGHLTPLLARQCADLCALYGGHLQQVAKQLDSEEYRVRGEFWNTLAGDWRAQDSPRKGI